MSGGVSMEVTNKTTKRIEIVWDSVPYGIDPEQTLSYSDLITEKLVTAGAEQAPAMVEKPTKKGK